MVQGSRARQLGREPSGRRLGQPGAARQLGDSQSGGFGVERAEQRCHPSHDGVERVPLTGTHGLMIDVRTDRVQRRDSPPWIASHRGLDRAAIAGRLPTSGIGPATPSREDEPAHHRPGGSARSTPEALPDPRGHLTRARPATFRGADAAMTSTLSPDRRPSPTGAPATAAIVGPATSAPTCSSSCSAATPSTSALWSASIRRPTAWRGRRPWASRPAPAVSTGCWPSRASRPRLRGHFGEGARRECAPLRGRRDHCDRPDPGGSGALRLPGGERGGTRGRAEHQHDHLRWPGDDPHRARGLPVVPVPYAEIVASIASRSAGPGTRANIDEFTETTAHAIESVGGAERGKAIIILNPVSPPMIMRDTVFCAIPADADRSAIAESIHRMVDEVRTYVPGYELRSDPQFDDPTRVARTRPGRGLPAGERQWRLPAAVGRKSRHHDRRRGARRRTDRASPGGDPMTIEHGAAHPACD